MLVERLGVTFKALEALRCVVRGMDGGGVVCVSECETPAPFASELQLPR